MSWNNGRRGSSRGNRYYGGRQNNRRQSYPSTKQRIIQLTKDIAKVDAGKKNQDSQVYQVYNETLSKGKTAKKPLY